MSSDDEEDWFERALRDDGDSAESGEGDDPTDGNAAESGLEEPVTDERTGSIDPPGGDGDEEPFDAGFAAAFEDAPAPEGFADGIDDMSTPVSDFPEESFDSDIPRIDIGIKGLDEMIQGGVPDRSLMVAIGDAGTGKTTFGLHFLNHALQQGENGVFITLEESYDRIIDTADDKGWDFSAAVDAGQLAVLDFDPIEMSNSLTSIRNELPSLIQEFGASRLVLDSVSLLEMMYDDQAIRRNQIYDFTMSLKDAGVTTMLTSEASESDPYHSRFGVIEYLTDAVFVLRYIRTDDFRETHLAVEIQKIRDANHSREMKPYEITNSGISVYRQANIF